MLKYGRMVQWREFRFRIAFEVRKGSNISNMRDSVSSGYPNTEKKVENITGSRVFLMKFEVFG